jgi:hypothetical protein
LLAGPAERTPATRCTGVSAPPSLEHYYTTSVCTCHKGNSRRHIAVILGATNSLPTICPMALRPIRDPNALAPVVQLLLTSAQSAQSADKFVAVRRLRLTPLTSRVFCEKQGSLGGFPSVHAERHGINRG